MEYSADEREQLADVFSGLANPARIAILFGLRSGMHMSAIADEIGMTRGGVQKHIEQLIDAELVYRPSEEDRTYALTALGNHLTELLENEGDPLLRTLSLVAKTEEDVRDEIGTAQELVDEIDEQTWERTVHTRKWEKILEDAEAILEK